MPDASVRCLVASTILLSPVKVVALHDRLVVDGTPEGTSADAGINGTEAVVLSDEIEKRSIDQKRIIQMGRLNSVSLNKIAVHILL